MQVTAETDFGTPDNDLNAEQLIAVATALGETTKQASLAVASVKTDLLAMAPKRTALQKDVDQARSTLNALTPTQHGELV